MNFWESLRGVLCVSRNMLPLTSSVYMASGFHYVLCGFPSLLMVPTDFPWSPQSLWGSGESSILENWEGECSLFFVMLELFGGHHNVLWSLLSEIFQLIHSPFISQVASCQSHWAGMDLVTLAHYTCPCCSQPTYETKKSVRKSSTFDGICITVKGLI